MPKVMQYARPVGAPGGERRLTRGRAAVASVMLALVALSGCAALPGASTLPPPPPAAKSPAVMLRLAVTPSLSATLSPSPTASPAPSATPSPSPSATPTASPTASATPPNTPTLLPPRLDVAVDPPRVVQGHTGVIRVAATLPVTLTGVLGEQRLAFAPAGQAPGYWALFGVSAVAQPGVRAVALTGVDALGRTVGATAKFEVVAGTFPTETLVLAPDRAALLDPKLVQAEREKLRVIFTAVTPRPLWDTTFTRPVTTVITSRFGTRRAYNDGPMSSYHEGNDFRGPLGLRVIAPAPGVVVLAEKLTVRGNAIILNHGLGVFTGYWHLSQIGVRPGDRVKRGQVIGRVGNTGLSTGAHLHWDLRVGNVNVDGLEWTTRKFLYGP